ncbi:MAG: hypothetical protein ACK5TQ_13610, partial [Acetobacteraceae bacterium]
MDNPEFALQGLVETPSKSEEVSTHHLPTNRASLKSSGTAYSIPAQLFIHGSGSNHGLRKRILRARIYQQSLNPE